MALRPWQLGLSAQRCAASLRQAHAALARAGLAEQALAVAGTLSHGAKRQLEVARCLATGPRVLLLDEPLAGMGAEETERMLALLQELSAATPCCWSSTTWTPCSASPTASP
jgi:branched-chain amino acid transport system ATP-binding protein